MEKQDLKKLIDVAAGRVKADLVIRNCKIVNVFSGTIQEGDIAVAGGEIAGIGDYEGETVVDACGRYAAASSTATSTSNPPMSLRKRSDAFWCPTGQPRSSPIRMRSSMSAGSGASII